MQKNHEGSVNIGGRTITNFANDIDDKAGEEKEFVSLVNNLESASSAYGIEISSEKTKLMTNNPNGIITDIKVNNQTLETVNKFKYLGAVITKGSSKPEVLSRIAQTTTTLTKLKPIWQNKSISTASKIRLLRSLVMSIFLYRADPGH